MRLGQASGALQEQGFLGLCSLMALTSCKSQIATVETLPYLARIIKREINNVDMGRLHLG